MSAFSISCLALGAGLTFGALCLPSPAAAQDFSNRVKEDEPVRFTSDSLSHDRLNRRVIAEGNVEVVYGSETLFADKLTYDEGADTIIAEGNVVMIQESGDTLYADRVELSSDMRDGIAREIRLRTADDANATAREAERVDGKTNILREATYSPCKPCEDDPEKPLVWQLKAEEIVHDEEARRVEYRDASLEFLGVPVMYTPWLSHADPRDKKASGFLVPDIGRDDDFGVYASFPYFLNIDPHRDLTIEPLLFPEIPQLVLKGEYRQATENGGFWVQGSATAITEDNDVGGTEPGEAEFRGHLLGMGRFDYDESWRWGFDLARATDDTYMRRYDLGNERTLTSRLFAENFDQRSFALLEAFSFQNQRLNRSDDLTPELVTNFTYAYFSEPQTYGSYFTADAGVLTVSRSDSTDTRRLMADIGWHLPYITEGGHVFEATAAIAGAAYQTDDLINRITGQEDDDVAFQAFPRMTLSWRYPLYRESGDYTHILEPRVMGVLSPDPDNNPETPNEDSQALEFSDINLFSANRYAGYDRFDGGQRIDYGLRWGVRNKDGGSGEIFLGQSFRANPDASLSPATGLDENFSDFVGYVQVMPNEDFDLSYRFRFDNKDLGLQQSILRFNGAYDPFTLTLDHTFVDADANTLGTGDRNEIFAQLDTKLNDYWSASVYERHRFSSPTGLVSAGIAFRYLDECFQADIAFERDQYEDRDLEPSNTIMLRFTLRNFGGPGNR